jgi:hypothetical protein
VVSPLPRIPLSTAPRVARAPTDSFGPNLEKRQIDHRKSCVAPSYKTENEPLKAPRTLKYDLKPESSRYMRETVENG